MFIRVHSVFISVHLLPVNLHCAQLVSNDSEHDPHTNEHESRTNGNELTLSRHSLSMMVDLVQGLGNVFQFAGVLVFYNCDELHSVSRRLSARFSHIECVVH